MLYGHRLAQWLYRLGFLVRMAGHRSVVFSRDEFRGFWNDIRPNPRVQDNSGNYKFVGVVHCSKSRIAG